MVKCNALCLNLCSPLRWSSTAQKTREWQRWWKHSDTRGGRIVRTPGVTMNCCRSPSHTRSGSALDWRWLMHSTPCTSWALMTVCSVLFGTFINTQLLSAARYSLILHSIFLYCVFVTSPYNEMTSWSKSVALNWKLQSSQFAQHTQNSSALPLSAQHPLN